MAGTVAATKQILMSDMFSADNNVNLRRLKTIPISPLQDGVILGLSYAYNIEHTIPAGEKIAINFNVFALAIVEVAYSDITPVKTYTAPAIGTGGAILTGQNLNCLSIDETPTQAQLFTGNITTQGQLLAMTGIGSANIIICPGTEFGVVLENKETAAQTISLSLVLTEVGERLPSVGLTPSTQITQTTEMSDYG